MPANQVAREAVGDYKAGWHDPENSTIRFDFGLSEQIVRDISALMAEMSLTICSESPKSKRMVECSGSCPPAL